MEVVKEKLPYHAFKKNDVLLHTDLEGKGLTVLDLRRTPKGLPAYLIEINGKKRIIGEKILRRRGFRTFSEHLSSGSDDSY